MHRFSFLLALVLVSADSPPRRDAAGAVQEDNDRFEREQTERIAGREKEPAERVFKNLEIDWLKNVPAVQLLDIMNYGYSRALGVRCTHCHAEGDFASDEKRPKRAAREMAVMHHSINQALARMENLEAAPNDRLINCATCHRGRLDPHEKAP